MPQAEWAVQSIGSEQLIKQVLLDTARGVVR
jgi:hypothetical protein